MSQRSIHAQADLLATKRQEPIPLRIRPTRCVMQEASLGNAFSYHSYTRLCLIREVTTHVVLVRRPKHVAGSHDRWRQRPARCVPAAALRNSTADAPSPAVVDKMLGRETRRCPVAAIHDRPRLHRRLAVAPATGTVPPPASSTGNLACSAPMRLAWRRAARYRARGHIGDARPGARAADTWPARVAARANW